MSEDRPWAVCASRAASRRSPGGGGCSGFRDLPKKENKTRIVLLFIALVQLRCVPLVMVYTLENV